LAAVRTAEKDKMKELIWLAGKLVQLAAALITLAVVIALGGVIGFLLVKLCTL
jgi:hypothetical protein